jgi:hypothetical protein
LPEVPAKTVGIVYGIGVTTTSTFVYSAPVISSTIFSLKMPYTPDFTKGICTGRGTGRFIWIDASN